MLEGVPAPSPPGSHRSHWGRVGGGRPRGQQRKPVWSCSSPGATFRGSWGGSPRNGHMADPFLPLWVQSGEAPSGLEYQGPSSDEAGWVTDGLLPVTQRDTELSFFPDS